MSNKKPLKIQIIIGTTRQNRFSEKAASFIHQELQKKKEIVTEVLDLRDYPLPFYNESVSPTRFEQTGHEFTDKTAKKWTDKIAEADGYIIVTAEYNHGYPAVLKNALDYVFKEWNKKAVGFVGYGNAGGARAIEQLRQVAVELDMLPIRPAIHIPVEVYRTVMKEQVPINLDLFQPLRSPVDRIETFLSELIWATKALKDAKENE